MNIKNSSGLSFDFLENGSIKSIEVDPIRISLKAATPFSKSGANIYLRKRTESIEFKALLGPESNSRFRLRKMLLLPKATGMDLIIPVSLQLSDKSLSWQWSIDIKNTSDRSC